MAATAHASSTTRAPPNCEAIETGQRVFIHALVDIKPGDELFIDCGLTVDEEITVEIRANYACRCAAPTCRQSMLAAEADTSRDFSDA